MGNAAAKEVRETKLSDGTLHKDDSMSIVPSLVTTEALKAKNKGSTWIHADSKDVLWKSKKVGMIKSHTLIKDSDDKVLATVIIAKMGMNTTLEYVCRATPTFEGQDPLTEEELKKAGIEKGTTLYGFSKIDTKRQMATGKSTYSIVTGKEGDELTFKELYTAKKLSAMGYQAIFKAGDICVAKAATHGTSFVPDVEAAVGVDLLAIVLIGYTLAGGDGSAGALAGAGAI